MLNATMNGKSMQKNVTVCRRTVNAIAIPSGEEISIPKNTFVTLSQQLGNHYTVSFDGTMARIDSEDADAIGRKIVVIQYEALPDGRIDDEQVNMAIRNVYDPEIPINIMDLGLIYDIDIDLDEQCVYIEMTLTSPTCGMAEFIVKDVEYELRKVPNVLDIQIELVFDPPWSQEMLSDEAKLETGLFF